MNSNIILLLYIVPLVVGILFISPLRDSLSKGPMLKFFPSLQEDTKRIFFGQTLIVLSGFGVSAHTIWIHNKITEGGNYCAAQALFDCDSVIGNIDYNTVPLLGIPWGWLGFIAFTLFLYFTRTIANEPQAGFVQNHIKYGKMMTMAGFAIIALLVYYEFKMGKICQYCTTAHIANVATFFGFYQIEKEYHSDAWKKLS